MPLYIPVRNKYLQFANKEKFVQFTLNNPDWKQTVAGPVIHEFLKSMNQNKKYPLFIGRTEETTEEDHLNKLP